MRRRVAIAAVALMVLAAAPAPAKIVIGKAIHGLGPGATEKHFRAVLGTPDGPRDFGEDVSDDEDRGIDTTQCAIRTGTTETDFNIVGGRVFEVVIDGGG